MAYTKQVWKDLPNETTPLSAERLNHMETQYEEAVQYVDNLPSNLKRSDLLSAFQHSPARPAGDYWPQGLSWEAEGRNWYVSMSGTVSGTPHIRIERLSESGGLLDFREFPSPAYCEGLPIWRDADGKVTILVRVDSGNASYALLDYDSGVVGPTVALPHAMHKSYLAGGKVWFTDASGGGGGVRTFFGFDADSVLAGNPRQTDTVLLEHRNLYHKMQSFAVDEEGGFWFTLGIPGNPCALAHYNSSGVLISMEEFSKPGFGSMVAEFTPGFPADVNNFGLEPEGICFRDGVLISGYVISNYEPTVRRYYLVQHSDQGVKVPSIRIGNPQDSSTEELPISNTTTYELATPTAKMGIARRGDLVEIKGAVKTKIAGWPGIRLAVVPAGFRPKTPEGFYNHVTATGTSASPNRFYIQVSDAGNVWLNHWGPSAPAEGQWLGIHISYLAE